jgi:hypothetical protein
LSVLVGPTAFADANGARRSSRAGGQATVPGVWYKALLSEVRYDPKLKAISDLLATAGDNAKLILTAVARKSLVLASTVMHTFRPLSPERATARDSRHRMALRALTPSAVAISATKSGSTGAPDRVSR